MVMKRIYSHIRILLNLLGIELHRIKPGNSEIKQLQMLLKIANVNLIFDIGANVGTFANDLIKAGFKEKIICYEPLTLPRRQLDSFAQKHPNIILHPQCAIGNFDGQVEINIARNSVSSSILPIKSLHVAAEESSAYVDKEIVPIFKLDSVSDTYLTCDDSLFIKIDTQGYESYVLEGSKNTLKYASCILCELSLVDLYDGQLLWRDIINFLESEGFIVWAVRKGFTHPNTGQTLQLDVFFVRPDRVTLI